MEIYYNFLKLASIFSPNTFIVVNFSNPKSLADDITLKYVETIFEEIFEGYPHINKSITIKSLKYLRQKKNFFDRVLRVSKFLR